MFFEHAFAQAARIQTKECGLPVFLTRGSASSLRQVQAGRSRNNRQASFVNDQIADAQERHPDKKSRLRFFFQAGADKGEKDLHAAVLIILLKSWRLSVDKL